MGKCINKFIKNHYCLEPFKIGQYYININKIIHIKMNIKKYYQVSVFQIINMCPSEYLYAPSQHWITREQVSNKDRRST